MRRGLLGSVVGAIVAVMPASRGISLSADWEIRAYESWQWDPEDE
jgi:hypothetical protein